MPATRRSRSTRITTRAVNAAGKPLRGLLQAGTEDCGICADARQLQARLEAEANAIIVYNRQAGAIALADKFEAAPAQAFIETRQDTRSVLGQQAYRKQDRASEAPEMFHE